MSETFRRGRRRLELDTSDAATPAMVYLSRGSREVGSSTFDCATGTGTVASYDGEDVELTQAENAWLAKFEDQVADAYDAARKDNPEYS